MTVDFYIYLFYEYIVLLLLIFVPSKSKNLIVMVCQMESRRVENTISAMNRYTVPVTIKSERIIWDTIGLSHSIDSFRTMFINKLFDYRTRAKDKSYTGVYLCSRL